MGSLATQAIRRNANLHVHPHIGKSEQEAQTKLSFLNPKDHFSTSGRLRRRQYGEHEKRRITGRIRALRISQKIGYKQSLLDARRYDKIIIILF